MKSRTSPGRQSSKPMQGNLLGTMTRPVGASQQSQKRWQPRQPKVIADPAPESVPALSKADREALLRKQALLAAQHSEQDHAIALFNELLRLNPESARDYNNRGLVYFQSGEHEKAIADYNHALGLDPRLDSAYNNRANYYAAVGMFLEAILDYDSAIDLNPTNSRAWINQGITFRELRMYERAVESFDCALSLGRLSSHIYAERGRTYHLWGDWNCAIADYLNAQSYLATPNAASAGSANRLRLQLEGWMKELLNPLEQG